MFFCGQDFNSKQGARRFNYNLPRCWIPLPTSSQGSFGFALCVHLGANMAEGGRIVNPNYYGAGLEVLARMRRIFLRSPAQ